MIIKLPIAYAVTIIDFALDEEIGLIGLSGTINFGCRKT